MAKLNLENLPGRDIPGEREGRLDYYRFGVASSQANQGSSAFQLQGQAPLKARRSSLE